MATGARPLPPRAPLRCCQPILTGHTRASGALGTRSLRVVTTLARPFVSGKVYVAIFSPKREPLVAVSSRQDCLRRHHCQWLRSRLGWLCTARRVHRRIGK